MIAALGTAQLRTHDGEALEIYPFDLEWRELDRFEAAGRETRVHEGQADFQDAQQQPFGVTWTVTESPAGMIESFSHEASGCRVERDFTFHWVHDDE